MAYVETFSELGNDKKQSIKLGWGVGGGGIQIMSNKRMITCLVPSEFITNDESTGGRGISHVSPEKGIYNRNVHYSNAIT